MYKTVATAVVENQTFFSAAFVAKVTAKVKELFLAISGVVAGELTGYPVDRIGGLCFKAGRVVPLAKMVQNPYHGLGDSILYRTYARTSGMMLPLFFRLVEPTHVAELRKQSGLEANPVQDKLLATFSNTVAYAFAALAMMGNIPDNQRLFKQLGIPVTSYTEMMKDFQKDFLGSYKKHNLPGFREAFARNTTMYAFFTLAMEGVKALEKENGGKFPLGVSALMVGISTAVGASISSVLHGLKLSALEQHHETVVSRQQPPMPRPQVQALPVPSKPKTAVSLSAVRMASGAVRPATATGRSAAMLSRLGTAMRGARLVLPGRAGAAFVSGTVASLVVTFGQGYLKK